MSISDASPEMHSTPVVADGCQEATTSQSLLAVEELHVEGFVSTGQITGGS